MTDSNSAPSQSSNSGPPDYEGTDPDLRDPEAGSKPRVSVSTVQVGASAAAAVTSALAASFFGVAGTLIGAAVGSIVSTIAGELYKHYLARAGERIKGTTNVVIQRLPSEVIATTPLRHLTNPSDLPGRESLQPIGQERGDERIAVPVERAGRLRQHPEGMAPLAAQNGSRITSGGQTGPSPSPWRKPLLAMVGVSAAGFLIALGVVVATETAIGHPVSGGDSGTTISRLGSNDSSKSEVKPTESVTEAPTPSDGAGADPAEPTASAEPTATEGGTDSGTDEQPTEQPTDPAATDSTDSGSSGSDSGAADTTGQDAAEATQAP